MVNGRPTVVEFTFCDCCWPKMQQECMGILRDEYPEVFDSMTDFSESNHPAWIRWNQLVNSTKKKCLVIYGQDGAAAISLCQDHLNDLAAFLRSVPDREIVSDPPSLPPISKLTWSYFDAESVGQIRRDHPAQ